MTYFLFTLVVVLLLYIARLKQHKADYDELMETELMLRAQIEELESEIEAYKENLSTTIDYIRNLN